MIRKFKKRIQYAVVCKLVLTVTPRDKVDESSSNPKEGGEKRPIGLTCRIFFWSISYGTKDYTKSAKNTLFVNSKSNADIQMIIDIYKDEIEGMDHMYSNGIIGIGQVWKTIKIIGRWWR